MKSLSPTYLYAIVVLVAIVLFSSCSMTKRRYSSGYHIEFRGNQQAKGTNDTKQQEYAKQAGSMKHETAEYAFLDDNSILQSPLSISPVVSRADSNMVNPVNDLTCDKIYFSDRTSIDAIISEITDTHIKYKKCNNPDGPLYTVSIDKINLIKFANGDEFIPELPEETLDTPQKNKPSESSEDARPIAGANIAGFILTIFAYIFFMVGLFIPNITFGIVFLSLALILSFVGLITGATGIKKRWKGLGISALIIGLIIFILALLFLILLLV